MRYTHQELVSKYKNVPWIMAYNRIEAIVDPKTQKVMYVETYGPDNGFFIEGWRALHFPLTSSIVEKSYREGGSTICILKSGKAKLKLVPSFSPIGIEECKIKKNNIEITIAGLGGGGVSASFSRGMAEGVKSVNVINDGGGTKLGKAILIIPKKRLLLIGVDDTDNNIEGATYSLVHNITTKISNKLNVRYSIHVNVQLYPYNPTKTKNCFATVVGIIFSTDKEKNKIINTFAKELKKNSFSKETGMAVYEGFTFNKKFTSLCESVKYKFIKDVNVLIKSANINGITTKMITGKRGLIGAIAALPFFDKPDFAVSLPTKP